MELAVAVDRNGPPGVPDASVVITLVTDTSSMVEACRLIARVAMAAEQSGRVTVLDVGEHAAIVADMIGRELGPLSARAITVRGPGGTHG